MGCEHITTTSKNGNIVCLQCGESLGPTDTHKRKECPHCLSSVVIKNEIDGSHTCLKCKKDFVDSEVPLIETVDRVAFTEVKDSGKREDFSTGSRRDTREGKGRYDLIAQIALKRLAQHYENGAKKYGDRNWEKGQPVMRYLDSANRHLSNILQGDKTEDHESAVSWNMFAYTQTLALIKLGKLPKELDDRPEHMRD
jgi:DNA-directed RNA polymerase subunit RPC12/RpoP